MSDFTMCTGGKCPLKATCYRFLAIPEPKWQSLMGPEFEHGGCAHFVPIEVGDRLKDEN